MIRMLRLSARRAARFGADPLSVVAVAVLVLLLPFAPTMMFAAAL